MCGHNLKMHKYKFESAPEQIRTCASTNFELNKRKFKLSSKHFNVCKYALQHSERQIPKEKGALLHGNAPIFVNFKVRDASLKACGGKFVRVSYAELTEGDGLYAAVFLSRSLIRQLFVHVVDAAAAVHIETEILRARSQGKELRLFARFALGAA